MIAALLSMTLLGLLHGLGPDHCLAVSALAARRSPSAVLRLALSFGVGHALVLLVSTLALRSLGAALPLTISRAGEWANGVLLVILGVGLAFERVGHKLTFHAHPHRHDGKLHLHPHLHPRPVSAMAAEAHDSGPHRHGPLRAAWATGALFAFSGVRSLAFSLPAAMQASHFQAALALICFAAGVVASMVGYGLVFGAARRWALARLPERALRMGLGAASMAFGLYWIASA